MVWIQGLELDGSVLFLRRFYDNPKFNKVSNKLQNSSKIHVYFIHRERVVHKFRKKAWLSFYKIEDLSIEGDNVLCYLVDTVCCCCCIIVVCTNC